MNYNIIPFLTIFFSKAPMNQPQAHLAAIRHNNPNFNVQASAPSSIAAQSELEHCRASTLSHSIPPRKRLKVKSPLPHKTLLRALRSLRCTSSQRRIVPYHDIYTFAYETRKRPIRVVDTLQEAGPWRNQVEREIL